MLHRVVELHLAHPTSSRSLTRTRPSTILSRTVLTLWERTTECGRSRSYQPASGRNVSQENPSPTFTARTLIEHVYQRASQATRVERVLVATDDERVFDVVTDFGGKAVMTSAEHPSGSDRIAEAIADIDVELVVNVPR